jgi:antitoxin component HigA of HigAB toxin-antitoxin module
MSDRSSNTTNSMPENGIQMDDFTARLKAFIDNLPKEEARFGELSKSFIDAVDFLLFQKGMTRAQLAFEIGNKPASISRILKNDRNLTLRSIAALETALDFEILTINFPSPTLQEAEPRLEASEPEESAIQPEWIASNGAQIPTCDDLSPAGPGESAFAAQFGSSLVYTENHDFVAENNYALAA